MAAARNHGIDLLRMVSMLFVVVLHMTGNVVWRGGRNFTEDPGLYLLYLVHCGSYCAVDCFAMISGYVGVTARRRWRSLAGLYCQVLFYSAGIAILSWALSPGHAGNVLFFLLPVSHRIYWYFTAYVALFILMPVLQAALRNLSAECLRDVLLAGFLLFSISGAVPGLAPYKTSLFKSGYNGAWLAWMYLWGGFLRLHGAKALVPSFLRDPARRLLGHLERMYVCMYVCSALACSLAPYLSEWATSRLPGGPRVVSATGYMSPLTILEAVCLLLIFRDLKPGAGALAMIRRLSPAAFGVYLIHEHPVVRGIVMGGIARIADAVPRACLLPLVAAASVAIYACCSLIDILRQSLCRMLKARLLKIPGPERPAP